MNIKITLIFSILLPLFSACSTQTIQPAPNSASTPVDSEVSIDPISDKSSLPIAGLTHIKSGKTLKLVRIMEGGVCKNKQQGAVGMFRLYASPTDITQIKKNQGPEVFSDFELQIQGFSMLALQHAINLLDFQDTASTQQQLAKKLTKSFSGLIADAIAKFETKTTLIIDVIPIQESMIIYLEGCETPHEH
ncbi:MAG: hypothetical protein GQ529_05255 [Methyloprofundus sp.]|nr:hypothetical protein [Methyloprofundus sp.]